MPLTAQSYVLILSTLNSLPVAQKIGRVLVQEKMIACVNLIPKIHSIYFWQDKICEDTEVLMVMKTRKALFSKLEKRLAELHPYEVPEILALPIHKGAQNYLDWISTNTQPFSSRTRSIK